MTDFVSPNLQTTTSSLKPQQPVPASFAPGTTSGTDRNKVPESYTTPKGYGKAAWNKEWDQYQAWRESKQAQLTSSLNYIRNLKEQLAQIRVQLSEAEETNNTAKAAEMREMAEVCLTAIPAEQATANQITRELAAADQWFKDHGTWPPKQTKADNAEDRQREYRNLLVSQQLGLEGIDKLIKEKQRDLEACQVVLAAATAALPETADIVEPDDISTAKRVSADLRRVLEELLYQRRLLVNGMAEALEAHKVELDRMDAEPESFGDVFSVTTVEPTPAELTATVVTAIQQATAALQPPTYPANSALWMDWYNPETYVVHSCLITGWVRDRNSKQSPVLYPEPKPLYAATLGVVLPNGNVYSDAHGLFSTAGAYIQYLALYYANAANNGEIESREYNADTAYNDPVTVARSTPPSEPNPDAPSTALTADGSEYLPPNATNTAIRFDHTGDNQ